MHPTSSDFLLFDVASALAVPFGIPQYVQCILHGLTCIIIFSHSSAMKNINLVVAHDFHNGNHPS